MTRTEVQREQLKDMIAFMEATPRQTVNTLDWINQMPFYPELYVASDWIECNYSIAYIWGEYKDELTRLGLTKRREEADELAVADLLIEEDQDE